MKHRLLTVLALAGLLAALGLAACGQEEELDVPEGEPVHLGELSYNVQITRFLNPSSTEDAVYLEGLPEPPPEKEYLAVFLKIDNEGEEATEIADELTVIDTRENHYDVIEAESDFALQLGVTVEGEGSVPAPGSPAASGPIKGAAALFLVDDGVTENRPLELEIPGHDGETGKVELDI